MYKLANDAVKNAKMIPVAYRNRCMSDIEVMFESNLRFNYTGDQLWWLILGYEEMGGEAPIEWWDFADRQDRTEGSQVWDLITMRRSSEAFRAAVVADWKSGVNLEFEVYPEHVLKSAEHLKPSCSEDASADVLIDALKARL